MRNFFLSLFDHAFSSCKRHKLITVWLVIALLVSVVLGVIAGIRINNSAFPQDFSNVGYVKYLRDSVGFAGFIFTEIFTILVFVFVAILTCGNVFSFALGVLFFMYFCYSQTVTIVSISMEFGFFNTIILMIFLIAINLLYFYLFLLVFVECFDCAKIPNYWSGCFITILPLLITFLAVALINGIFLMVLKNFVFILVYK